MKSKAYYFGIAAGVLAAAIVVIILRTILKKKTDVFSNEYDERQKAIQGTGYKLAYFTMMILVALGGLISVVMEKFPLSITQFAIVCIVVSVCVFVTYCIVKDAYLSFRTKRKNILCIWLAVGAVNLAMAFIPGLTGEITEVSFVNLLVGIALLYLSIVMLVKTLIERKGGEE